MTDLILRLGLQFTNEEREKCLDVAKRMIDLALVAHEQGIFGMSEVVSEATSNDFTIMAVEILKIGYDSETLKKALEYSLVTNNHTGEQLLERLIIAESLITISDTLGHTEGSLLTKSVAVAAGAMLGESYVLPLIRYADSLNITDVEMLIDEYTTPLTASEPFEKKLLQLSKLELCYALTALDVLDVFQIASALIGCKKTFLHHIQNCLREYYFASICMTFKFLTPRPNETAILAAQDEILTYIEDLRTSGVL